MYTKLIAAAVVLVVGVALASLFPKDASNHSDGASPPGGVALRGSEEASGNSPRATSSDSSLPIGAASLPDPVVTSRPDPLAWSGQAQAALREPPPMPADYAALAEGSAVTQKQEQPTHGQVIQPVAPAERNVRHQVVDGDTLEHLAAQYLGDASLGYRISEANGGNLADPLVVGAALEIPPRSQIGDAKHATARMPRAQTRLVPVEPPQVMADADPR
jgi:nucleoid-associated protein YgaU